MNRPIFHIVEADIWAHQKEKLYYFPQDLDEIGFIHCCYEEQLNGVLNRYFQGKRNVLVLEIDPQLLESPWKLEESRPGEWFPHILGVLNTNAVKSVKPHRS